MKVLIVDDEPDICFFIEYEIKENGNETFTANDGLEALEILKNNPDIEIIISDVKMPKMDGIEFLKESQLINNKIKKFIFITGFSDLDEDKAKSLGAFALLPKPIQLDDLLKQID
ncbi:MAG: hypothetical protein CL678_10440 [Bdellovibrionaceae bacterium]|nr:hypothetical protein [Pseudobdellovibrionaceae bacterium]|tara:strand:- start:1687 stop:2031 length:345 start_codon:yes stop_codon:yes gene_type:complete